MYLIVWSHKTREKKKQSDPKRIEPSPLLELDSRYVKDLEIHREIKASSVIDKIPINLIDDRFN